MTTINLFDLFAKITLDSKDYEKGLSDAQGKTSNFASKLGSGLKTAGKVGAAAIGAVTLAATAAAAAMVKGINETADYGDNVDKMSQKLGLSTQAYQEWDYVLQIAGTDIDSMSAGLKTLTNKFDDAVNGSESAINTFERLGLSMDDISSMSREELFAEVITAFQGMEDSAERAALANDLFGRSGQELAPLFNTTADETRDLIEEVNKLNGVMSEDAVKASAEYKDTITGFQTAISGIKRGITQEFLPGVTDMIAGFTSLITGEEDAQEKLTNGLSSISQSVENVIPRIVSAITDIGGAIVAAAPQILEAGIQLVTSLVDAIGSNSDIIANAAFEIINVLVSSLSDPSGLLSIIDVALKIIASLAKGLAKNLPTLIPAIVNIALTIVEKLTDPDTLSSLVDAAILLMEALATGLIDSIDILLERAPIIIDNLVTALIENAPKLLAASIEILLTFAKGILDTLGSVFSQITEKISTWFQSEVIEPISNFFSEIWAKIEEFFAPLIDFISPILDALAELFDAIWLAIKTIVSNALNEIKNVISNVWNWIKDSVIKPVLESIKEAVKSAFDALYERVKSPLDKVKSLVNDTFNNIKNTITNIVSSAKTWGQDLINNFVSGIQSVVSNVASAISGVASTIKSLLGFSEPEKGPLSDFHTYAPDMMDLFAEGVRQNTKKVRDQIAKSFDFSDMLTFSPNEMTFTGEFGSDFTTEQMTIETNTDRKIDQLIAIVSQYLPQVANMKMVLDKGTIVGELAPDMDLALGGRSAYVLRGNAV